MWQRNNGQAEDDLQFRFTAYLVSAVKRRRKDYLIQLYKRSSIESTVEVVYESEPSSEEVVLDKLPLMDVIENGALLEALQKLNERERQIFLARTLEEEDFETLGVKFELSYKGAAALYYRTIQKIRKSIEGAIQGTAGFVHWYKAGCFCLSQPAFVRCRSPPEAQEIHRNS